MNNEILTKPECPICFDEIINVVELSCGHIYCKNCILEWKERDKDICPLCRERIIYVMYNNRKRTLIHLDYNICHLYIVEYCNLVHIMFLLVSVLFLFYYLKHNKDENENYNITYY